MLHSTEVVLQSRSKSAKAPGGSVLLREPLGACRIGRIVWMHVMRRTRLGRYWLCPAGRILVILDKARLVHCSQAAETELRIKGARCIGAPAVERPGEWLGFNKEELVPKNVRTTGEKMEKADATMCGGCPTGGAPQKCVAKQDWCSGALAGRGSITGLGKLSGKNGGVTSNDMVNMEQTTRRQRDGPQAVITHFFTSGGQANGSAAYLKT
ncbi:hypothetical protein NDU88_010213 [Pleurodeles waltl]|uniref:Uncharacterized protein n=1 Tax=Pleurodeles waltl TaxID=8319 RepID=A0AAV7S0I1_PLEWA|nr:hypothetical protein NDU88_010213 [Pleurodeles waltl]